MTDSGTERRTRGTASVFGRLFRGDGGRALLVFCMAGIMGSYVLFLGGYAFVTRHSPKHPLNLGISVMVATGRGFVEPCGDGVRVRYPEGGALEAFLLRERDSLSPDDLPADLPVAVPKSDWILRHRYLFVSVGLLWRMLGISWSVVDGLRVFFFCVMSASVYGLFRLGLGRRTSLLAAALLTAFPLMLFYSWNLRDFSKGAFILPAMFLIGWLAARPRGRRGVLLASLALGLLAGVGIGFRADMLACLAPSFFAVLFCRTRPNAGGAALRASAVALLAGAFLVPGLPILLEFRGTGINAYDASMGFATLNDDNMEVARASYERVYVSDDSFVSAAISDRAARRQRAATPLTPVAENRNLFFRDTALFFPGDMLTRAYAAVLWVLRLGEPLNLFFMPACALVMLGVLAWRDRRAAWTVFLFGMYFCGYVCLQADYRHKFHLAFVPAWVLGFLLQEGCSAVRSLGRTARGKRPWTLPPPDWRRRLAGTALFFAGAGLLLAVPLATARAWQERNIRNMLPLYQHPGVEEVATLRQPLGDWTLFRRTVCEPPGSGMIVTGSHRGAYWVVELAPSARWRRLWVQYAAPAGGTVSFSHGLHVSPSPPGDSADTVRYFLPVYEDYQVEDPQWCVFAGIALPPECSGDFVRLCRVTDTTPFPWLLNLTLPDDLSAFRTHQSLLGGPEGGPGHAKEARWWFPEHNPLFRLPLLGNTAPDAAADAARYRAALSETPQDTLPLVGLGASLAAAGDREGALAAYREALQANPRDYLAYRYLDALFGREGGATQRLALWQTAAAQRPDLFLPHFHLALALEDAGNAQGAVAAYSRAVEIRPEDLETLKRAGLLARSAGMRTEAEQLFGRARALAPNDPTVTWFFLEKAAEPGPPDEPGKDGT